MTDRTTSNKSTASHPRPHLRGAEPAEGPGGAQDDVGTSSAATPDTQEALYAADGAWDIAEIDGVGRRHATAGELQIEADALTVTDELPDPDAD